jgi:hypothetical protein
MISVREVTKKLENYTETISEFYMDVSCYPEKPQGLSTLLQSNAHIVHFS